MHAFQATIFLHCHSHPYEPGLYPSGRFWCSRHTSLYRDSLNLVTREIIAPHTPMKIVAIAMLTGARSHRGCLWGSKRGVPAAVRATLVAYTLYGCCSPPCHAAGAAPQRLRLTKNSRRTAYD